MRQHTTLACRTHLIVDKPRGNYIFLLLVTLCFLSSLKAVDAHAAWEMQSDLRLAVGNDLLDRAVAENFRSFNGEEAFRLNDMQISSSGIPVTISGISGRVRYNLVSPRRAATGLIWETASDAMSAELYIQRIYASTIIRREFNGGVINIRVEGICDDVRMAMPVSGGASVFARVRASLSGSSLSLRADQTRIDWPANSWQVTKLECRGVEGFGETVRREALKFLATPQQEVQTGLYNAVQARLNQWASAGTEIAVTPRLIIENRPDILLQTQPLEMGELNGSVLINGLMRVLLPNVPSAGTEIPRYSFRSAPTALGASEMQIPVSAVGGSIMAALFSNSLRARVNGQDFSGFEALMHDRRAQAFAFPDLQNFHVDTAFQFDVSASSAPVLNNIRRGADGASVDAELAAPMTIVMLAPKAEIRQYVPYVRFQAVVRGTANFRAVEGKLQLRVASPKVELSAAWNQTYVKTYKPSNLKIDTGLMAPRLASSISSEVFSSNLPYWQWTNGRRLVPVRLSVDQDQLKLFWDLRSDPPTSTGSTVTASSR